MVDYDEPADGVDWKIHRTNFEQRVRSWCRDHGIDFFGTYDEIQASRSEKCVKLTVTELVIHQRDLILLDAEMQSKGQHLFYLTDNLLDAAKLCQFKNITFISINALIGMMSLALIRPNTAPSRLYNCFIQRVDSVRQSWFYFLHDHDLLTKGYVSFLLFQYGFYSDKTGRDLYDWIHHHYQLSVLPHFDRAYHELRASVPYRNFPETKDLHGCANNSKYSLVLETYAVEDGRIGFCFTEKTYRSLQTPTINLIFAQQNSLAHLSQLGFEINEAMLDIDCCLWVHRQQRILDILINDHFDFDAELLYNQAVINRDVIDGFKHEFLKGDFLEEVFSDILAA